MYLYSAPPVDHFAAFQPVEDFFARSRDEGDDAAVRAFVETYLSAIESGTYYEAKDRSAGPFVSALPHEDYTYPTLIVSVKSQNNGTFYLASPVELPWLSEFLTAEVDGPDTPDWSLDRIDW